MEHNTMAPLTETQPTPTAKNRSTAPAKAQGPAETGFGALLAALDDALRAADAVTDAPQQALSGAAPDRSADAAQGVVDASAIALWQGAFWPVVQAAQGGMLQGDDAVPSALDGDLLRAAKPASAEAQRGAIAPDDDTIGIEGRPQGLPAETALCDAEPQAAPPLAAARSWARPHSHGALRKDALGAGMAWMTAAATDASSRLHPVPPAPQTTALTALQAASERLAARGEAGGAAQTGPPGVHAIDAALAPLPDAPALAASPARGAEPGTAHGAGADASSHRLAAAPGVWPDGAWPGAAARPGQDLSAHGAAPFAPEQVAEQIAYWVQQKTQNAQLTLERDGRSVEVSVSLSGNEAHVSFGSDQPQLRELLGSGMEQLSELLRGEGLVLGGMSVGTPSGHSAGFGADGAARKREGLRQTQRLSLASVEAAPALRTVRPSAHTIDVFV